MNCPQASVVVLAALKPSDFLRLLVLPDETLCSRYKRDYEIIKYSHEFRHKTFKLRVSACTAPEHQAIPDADAGVHDVLQRCERVTWKNTCNDSMKIIRRLVILRKTPSSLSTPYTPRVHAHLDFTFTLTLLTPRLDISRVIVVKAKLNLFITFTFTFTFTFTPRYVSAQYARTIGKYDTAVA